MKITVNADAPLTHSAMSVEVWMCTDFDGAPEIFVSPERALLYVQNWMNDCDIVIVVTLKICDEYSAQILIDGQAAYSLHRGSFRL